MENYEEVMDATTVESTEETRPEHGKTSKGDEYGSAFLVGFIGGAATALGKAFVDWGIPKIKEHNKKVKEKRKAKKEEKQRAKEEQIKQDAIKQLEASGVSVFEMIPDKE